MKTKQAPRVFDVLDGARVRLVSGLLKDGITNESKVAIRQAFSAIDCTKRALEDLVFGWHLEALNADSLVAREAYSDCAFALNELKAW